MTTAFTGGKKPSILKIILRGLFAWILMPFSWSRWNDISTFMFGYDGYLLQGRVNRVSNAKEFRITRFRQLLSMANVPSVTIERVKEIG